MKISAIVAIGKNREIGLKNQMLWHIKSDFKNFKNLTMGHYLVMGRKTFESIGKPLPGRNTIVLTSDLFYKAENCHMAHSVDEALAFAKKKKESELFVCGGVKVYKDFLPLVDTLYLSKVSYEGTADAFFPPYEHFNWLIEEEKYHSAVGDQLAWTYQKLIKKN